MLLYRIFFLKMWFRHFFVFFFIYVSHQTERRSTRFSIIKSISSTLTLQLQMAAISANDLSACSRRAIIFLLFSSLVCILRTWINFRLDSFSSRSEVQLQDNRSDCALYSLYWQPTLTVFCLRISDNFQKKIHTYKYAYSYDSLYSSCLQYLNIISFFMRNLHFWK